MSSSTFPQVYLKNCAERRAAPFYGLIVPDGGLGPTEAISCDADYLAAEHWMLVTHAMRSCTGARYRVLRLTRGWQRHRLYGPPPSAGGARPRGDEKQSAARLVTLHGRAPDLGGTVLARIAAGVGHLCKLSALDLVELELTGFAVGPDSLPKLLDGLAACVHLRHLCLSGCRGGNSLFADLVIFLRRCRDLRDVNLTDFGLTDDAARDIAGLFLPADCTRSWQASLRKAGADGDDALRSRQSPVSLLETLTLDDNYVGDATLDAIGAVLNRSGPFALRRLSLRRTGVTVDGAAACWNLLTSDPDVLAYRLDALQLVDLSGITSLCGQSLDDRRFLSSRSNAFVSTVCEGGQVCTFRRCPSGDTRSKRAGLPRVDLPVNPHSLRHTHHGPFQRRPRLRESSSASRGDGDEAESREGGAGGVGPDGLPGAFPPYPASSWTAPPPHGYPMPPPWGYSMPPWPMPWAWPPGGTAWPVSSGSDRSLPCAQQEPAQEEPAVWRRSHQAARETEVDTAAAAPSTLDELTAESPAIGSDPPSAIVVSTAREAGPLTDRETQLAAVRDELRSVSAMLAEVLRVVELNAELHDSRWDDSMAKQAEAAAQMTARIDHLQEVAARLQVDSGSDRSSQRSRVVVIPPETASMFMTQADAQSGLEAEAASQLRACIASTLKQLRSAMGDPPSDDRCGKAATHDATKAPCKTQERPFATSGEMKSEVAKRLVALGW